MARWQVSSVSKIYAALVFVESIVLIVAAAMAIKYSYTLENPSRQVPYAVLGIFASVAFVLFSLDSILLENKLQLRASIAAHVFINIWILWSLCNPSGLTEQFKLGYRVLMGIVSTLTVVYLVLGPLINRGFGWRDYKRIGTSVELQRIYHKAEVFLTWLKVDFFLSVFLVTLAVFYVFENNTEILINSVALVITFIWAYGGWKMVQRERTDWLRVWWILALAQPLYVVQKLYQLSEESGSTYTHGQFYLIGSFSIICRALTLLWSRYASTNFGKGLKKVYQQRKVWVRSVAPRTHTQSVSQAGSYQADSEEAKFSPLADVQEYAAPLCAIL